MENKLTDFQKTRLMSSIILILMMITIWYMLDLVLLTFIITFVSYHLMKKIEERYKALVGWKVPSVVILALIYILYILAIVLISSEVFPRMTAQFTSMAHQISNFDMDAFMAAINPRVATLIGHINLGQYLADAGMLVAVGATAIGGFAVNFFIAMVLSFVLLSEQGKIKKFGENMAHSKIAPIYEYVVKFGGDFCRTFGKVMKVQVTIAFINCLISMVALKLIGFSGIFSLGFMIFCLGLVPVAGVIISLIPLSILAFSLGGIIKIVEVIAMIILIHTLETYVLNPKLMADKTRLPVCFVFIILLVSQHYLGTWGLLIGVPIFIFAMNLLNVDYEIPKEKRKKEKVEEIQKKADDTKQII